MTGHNVISLSDFFSFRNRDFWSFWPPFRRSTTRLILFSHGLLPDMFAFSLKKILFFKEIILVSTLHNAIYEDYRYAWKYFGLLLAFIHCRILDSYDVIVCCADWLVNYYRTLLNAKYITSVPNSASISVDISDKCDLYDKRLFGVYNSMHSVIRLISSCTLTKRKNIGESLSFLNSFSSLAIKHEYHSHFLHYLIAGSWP